MSEQASASPASAGPWPVLDVHERRVLGVLVEKGKMTPDAYPLSMNAILTGCNQKTNRDPVLELEDWEVEDAVGRCKEKGLLAKIVGGRVERHKHLLYDALRVDKVEIAIMGELLLRGPQTEGELRTRASRMEPIEDLETLRATLKPLVQRNLVLYLTAEDRRGAMLTHGFHSPKELEGLRRMAAGMVAAEPVARPSVRESAAPPAPLAAKPDERVADLVQTTTAQRQEIASLQERVAVLEKTANELRGELKSMRGEFEELKKALGG